ncbi:hypothetical protein SAMN05446635_9922 [Burkholderia sp. OK233]|nr:hypothetical protein SAMN05446635_9922 [Burkholderia sp. OK233]
MRMPEVRFAKVNLSIGFPYYQCVATLYHSSATLPLEPPIHRWLLFCIIRYRPERLKVVADKKIRSSVLRLQFLVMPFRHQFFLPDAHCLHPGKRHAQKREVLRNSF